MGYFGCEMLGMWDVWDVVCGMFGMWDVRDVGCLGCECSGYGIFGVWDVRDVGYFGCEMLGKWDVWDVGCGMFAGMWGVDLQNAITHLLQPFSTLLGSLSQ